MRHINMALNASKISSGNKRAPQELLEPGNYPARVVQVIGLGVQAQRPWEGEAKPPAMELMVTYELTTEFMKDENGEDIKDKPRWISERFPMYSLKSELAKSTKRYKGIDPNLEEGGDWAALLGRPCLVNVVQNVSKSNGRTYNNVGAVSPPIVGMEIAELVNEPRVFDPDEPDMDVWETIPEWVQDIIKDNLEFPSSALEAALGGSTPPKSEPASVVTETPF